MVGKWGCGLHKVAAKEPCRLVDSVKPKYPQFLQKKISGNIVPKVGGSISPEAPHPALERFVFKTFSSLR